MFLLDHVSSVAVDALLLCIRPTIHDTLVVPIQRQNNAGTIF
jgi:hypothetical protein